MTDLFPNEKRCLEIAARAGERWLGAAKRREPNLRHVAEGAITEVEPPERIRMRLNRLAKVAVRAQRPPARDVPRLVEAIGLERVLGDPDFMGIDFLESALAVSRTVGRVRIRAGTRRGSGTGFLVSPRLFLTNHHVLPDSSVAGTSSVDFDYQEDRDGDLLPTKSFAFRPSDLFLADEALDYALVALAPRSMDGAHELSAFGWNRLVEDQGKALIGDPVNIVQHPRGEPKQIVLRENRLLDLLEDFAHYETDTQPGSSGSPVFNDQWEVIALHHSGVPRTEGGRIIDRDGQPWDGRDADDIDWVANEGVRISRVVGHVLGRESSSEPLIKEMLETEPPDLRTLAAAHLRPRPVPVPPPGPAPHVAPSPTPAHPIVVPPPGPRPAAVDVQLGPDGAATWTIPIELTVRLGGSTAPPRPMPPHVPPLPFAPEAISIDPDYSTRRGYDDRFLGDGEHRVRLPWLTNRQYSRVAFNREPHGGPAHVLPYHHFSVVMNRDRRLAYFTAGNIDGANARDVRRESDRWILDPRIEPEFQAGESVYSSNPLDRGHLVRRLDPAWGESFDVAKVANDDTFHFTNCAPQHLGLNRNRSSWAGVENYILDNAKAHDLRVTVFTGPVFREDDPLYRDEVHLPRQFWKVVAMVRADDGELSATAYLLSQAELVDAMLEEDFAFGAYRTFQVPVRRIEELTELSFRGLTDHDPLEVADAPEGVLEVAGARTLPIRDLDQIVL